MGVTLLPEVSDKRVALIKGQRGGAPPKGVHGALFACQLTIIAGVPDLI